MTAPLVRLYIAASLDGYIATSDGGVDWLEPYHGVDVGYDAFIAAIGTIIMGRATYDQVFTFSEWPYAGKSCLVLSSRPLGAVPDGVERVSGDVAAIVEQARRRNDGDIWLVGGARTARAFLDLGLIDRIELYVIPVLLGDGLRLFEPSCHGARMALERAEALPRGMVRLVYSLR